MSRTATVQYIVDGYNVIRRVDRLQVLEREGGLEAGRDALLREVRASMLVNDPRRPARVTLVFDGSVGGSALQPEAHPRIVVRFSRPPQDADAAILSLLRRYADTSSVTVVTSDTELAWETRKLGAATVSPAHWLASLASRTRRTKRTSVASGKPSPTHADVEWGLRVFGDERVDFMEDVKPGGGEPSQEKTMGEPSSAERADLSSHGRIRERRRARHLRRTRRH